MSVEAIDDRTEEIVEHPCRRSAKRDNVSAGVEVSNLIVTLPRLLRRAPRLAKEHRTGGSLEQHRAREPRVPHADLQQAFFTISLAGLKPRPDHRCATGRPQRSDQKVTVGMGRSKGDILIRCDG